ncbi:hypothetical protein SCACP_01410 [Sporomusa carbonis]|uniref:aspartyl-phosphate phosphatase Spo0E family protein n=1 Tax=Sporomusa carbonis TaxID=3076075 RepID=UPI003A71FF13
MGDLSTKEQEIERVRFRLHQLVVNKRGNLSDKEVAELSSHLDRLIVEYQHARGGNQNRALANKKDLWK